MFKEIADLIHNNQEFVLTSHVNPDGDSIGSEIALFNFLSAKGKKARVINYSETPSNYRFLDSKNIIEKFDEKLHADIIAHSDVVFIIDTNEYERLRTMAPYVKESKAKKVLIDHHMGLNGNGFDYYISDTESPSTAEILYKFFKFTGEGIKDKDTAIALYTAIMTDTGSFRFERTDTETHLIAAELLSFGINPYKVYSEVYNNSTPGKLKLLGRFLENIKLAHGGKLSYSHLLIKDFEETGTDEYATDGYSHHMLSLGSVVLSVFLTQTKRGVKLSFRSKGNVRADELAREFGGGGHINAAGSFVVGGSMDELILQSTEKAKKYIN